MKIKWMHAVTCLKLFSVGVVHSRVVTGVIHSRVLMRVVHSRVVWG